MSNTNGKFWKRNTDSDATSLHAKIRYRITDTENTDTDLNVLYDRWFF